MSKKIELGQFFTKKEVWLKKQIINFIKESKCNIAYDPFAGQGDILKIAKNLGFKKILGLDVDKKLKWKLNDSLVSIPKINNSIIITNPPYLAKQSATRKKINLAKYFSKSIYDDLYLIALQRMLENHKYIVAIVPESFINSNFKQKYLLNSITILEENPFIDTENPVCVVCFDGVSKTLDKVKIYKNNTYIDNLENINKFRLLPNNSIDIKFNDLTGWLGLRAIDSTDDKTFIYFDFKENFKYDWKNKIKNTSRHFSLININIKQSSRKKFIKQANLLLKEIRNKSQDVLLTPFKGNTKNGKRRRRLDFKLARAILERSYDNVCKKEQLLLF